MLDYAETCPMITALKKIIIIKGGKKKRKKKEKKKPNALVYCSDTKTYICW